MVTVWTPADKWLRQLALAPQHRSRLPGRHRRALRLAHRLGGGDAGHAAVRRPAFHALGVASRPHRDLLVAHNLFRPSLLHPPHLSAAHFHLHIFGLYTYPRFVILIYRILDNYTRIIT